MKGQDIYKELTKHGVVLGDCVLVTERLSRGRTGQRYYTLDGIGTYTLQLSDRDIEGGKYTLRFNEIERIEPADTL